MNGEKGFTYPAALLLIIIVSISLMVVQKQWSTVVKREKEIELFFRAEQIIDGIESFYKSSSKDSQQYPSSLKVLLKDNRFQGLKRHLRKIYRDPMTKDGQWGIIYDGKGGIKGIFSKSKDEPIKKGNFPEIYKSFEKKTKYLDWKFVYEPKEETTS
ncbi:MAG: type II secretion system protein [Desulfobacula sp.]|nr:type II secretion system protein [Desulfobacula sp.]